MFTRFSLFTFVIAILPLLLSAISFADLSGAKHFMVPMRDGTKLSTYIWFPEVNGPWPVLVARSPYEIGGSLEVAGKGYVYVWQNTRGRFGSEGANTPVLNDGWGEHQDGYDCIKWVSEQTWCNGEIGTFGGSALGFTQYFLAPTNPPNLRCQWVSVSGPSLYHHIIYQSGALRKSNIDGWQAVTNFDPKVMESLCQHTSYDDFWKQYNALEVVDRVNVPAFHDAGWYDLLLQGNIDAFVALQHHGGPGARGKQKLLIGPWWHIGRTPQIGEIKFPDNSTDPGEFGNPARWFGHYLRDEKSSIENEPAVMYYLMGAEGEPDAPGNVWKTAEDWPVKAKETNYYLRTGGRLTLSEPSEESAFKSYEYDPKDPVPSKGGLNLFIESGPMDQRPVEGRKDVLIFSTDPLKEPVEVTGRVKVKLYASSSAKDTDFTAKLCDVYPDGRSMLICDGIIRARHRKSLSHEVFLKPGEVYEFEIDLWSTAIVFNKGHRIRVDISSSNYPRFDANPNTGGKFNDELEPIVAENKVFFDAKRPSSLILPVVR